MQRGAPQTMRPTLHSTLQRVSALKGGLQIMQHTQQCLQQTGVRAEGRLQISQWMAARCQGMRRIPQWLPQKSGIAPGASKSRAEG